MSKQVPWPIYGALTAQQSGILPFSSTFNPLQAHAGCAQNHRGHPLTHLTRTTEYYYVQCYTNTTYYLRTYMPQCRTTTALPITIRGNVKLPTTPTNEQQSPLSIPHLSGSLAHSNVLSRRIGFSGRSHHPHSSAQRAKKHVASASALLCGSCCARTVMAHSSGFEAGLQCPSMRLQTTAPALSPVPAQILLALLQL